MRPAASAADRSAMVFSLLNGNTQSTPLKTGRSSPVGAAADGVHARRGPGDLGAHLHEALQRGDAAPGGDVERGGSPRRRARPRGPAPGRRGGSRRTGARPARRREQDQLVVEQPVEDELLAGDVVAGSEDQRERGSPRWTAARDGASAAPARSRSSPPRRSPTAGAARRACPRSTAAAAAGGRRSRSRCAPAAARRAARREAARSGPGCKRTGRAPRRVAGWPAGPGRCGALRSPITCWTGRPSSGCGCRGGKPSTSWPARSSSSTT